MCVCMLCAKSLQSCLFATLKTIALQVPLSLGFSRQKYWDGLPFPSPGDLPDQGLNLGLLGLLQCRCILYRSATRDAHIMCYIKNVHIKIYLTNMLAIYLFILILYVNGAIELTGSNFSAVDFKVFSIHPKSSLSFFLSFFFTKSSFLTPHCRWQFF